MDECRIPLEDGEHPAPAARQTRADEDQATSDTASSSPKRLKYADGMEWRGRVDPKLALDPSRRLLQIAPQLHVMDTHFRMFLRQFTREATLWSEMVVDSTLIHTQALDQHLKIHELEQPIVCQLGGSDPASMGEAARIVREYGGYESLNINVGCPSNKVVEKGCFGAVLMTRPELVASCCKAMHEASGGLPVSVKTRIGLDDVVGGQWLRNNIATFASSHVVSDFVMHARPAFLRRKITPAKNRSIPPLNYDAVFELEREFSEYRFTLNGGVQSLEEVEALLRVPSFHDPTRAALEGVMVGRLASDNPAVLADVDRRLYGRPNPDTAYSRRTALEGYVSYLDEAFGGTELQDIKHAFRFVRPVVGVLHSTRASGFHRRTLDKLVRQHACTQTPAWIITELIDLVDKAHPGVLDEPLTSSACISDAQAPESVTRA